MIRHLGLGLVFDDDFSTYAVQESRARKDDRAMRPIYGCPEKFQESLAICPWLLYPKFIC